MNEKIRRAFEPIKAEHTLKEETLRRIYARVADDCRQSGRKRRLAQKHAASRMALVFASVCILVLFTGVSYRVYAMPEAYVDVDVNPSIELTINRFDRVIGIYAYNEEGAAVLSQVNLKHKTAREAFDLLMAAIERGGYMDASGLLSITVQSEHGQQNLVRSLEEHVSGTVGVHHANMTYEVMAVDKQTKAHAHEMDVSPARYLAIMALKQANPGIDMEECQSHTLSELRESAGGHGDSDCGSGHSEGGEGHYH